MSTSSFCVIGAGAAGLAAVRALVRAGREVTCYEKTDQVGGHWHTDYDALFLITPRTSSGFADEPMPASYPMFPSRDQMRDYLVSYATHHRLAERIRFSTEVTSIAPFENDARQGWSVSTSGGVTRHFDGVIVANGHLWDPIVPPIASSFAGTSLHSSQYSNPDDVEGNRVLVVGAGNSGCDLAVDVAQAGLATAISVRRGQIYQPKTLFGRPRSEIKSLSRLPPILQERVLRWLVRVSVGNAEQHGFPTPASSSLFKNPPVVNTLLPYWIAHGRVRVVPEVVGIDGRTVKFADGTAEDFDTVLWATGFRVSLPFLEPSTIRWRDGVPLRVAGGILPIGQPRLFFLGMIAPRGPQLPVYSAQAELLIDFLKLQDSVDTSLAASFGDEQSATYTIDELRHVWERDMQRTRRKANRMLAKLARVTVADSGVTANTTVTNPRG